VGAGEGAVVPVDHKAGGRHVFLDDQDAAGLEGGGGPAQEGDGVGCGVG
jgi:hypothetical protein